MCSYLYRRGGVYCTRMVVPPRLRPIIGKSDLGRSLRTKDSSRRQAPAARWLAEAQSIIAAAETELARGTAPAANGQPIRSHRSRPIGRPSRTLSA